MNRRYLYLFCLLMQSCSNNPLDMIEGITKIKIKAPYELVNFDYTSFLGDDIFNGLLILDSNYVHTIDFIKLGYLEIKETKSEIIKDAWKQPRDQINQLELSEEAIYKVYIKKSKYHEVKIFRNIIWFVKRNEILD